MRSVRYRDPLACVLGTRESHMVAKRKTLVEERDALAKAIASLERDITKVLAKRDPADALRAHKLAALYADKQARFALVLDLIASGKRFR